MILVTVGWHDRPFTRLVARMDEIADRIDEEVIIQKGHTRFDTSHATSFDFLPSDEEFLELFDKARVVVSHGGAGTILDSLVRGKRTIVVPRLRKFGEHENDHQLELSKALEGRKLVTVVQDVDRLERILREPGGEDAPQAVTDDSLSRHIRERMETLVQSNSRQ